VPPDPTPSPLDPPGPRSLALKNSKRPAPGCAPPMAPPPLAQYQCSWDAEQAGAGAGRSHGRSATWHLALALRGGGCPCLAFAILHLNFLFCFRKLLLGISLRSTLRYYLTRTLIYHLNIDEYQACPPPPFPISISEERRAGPATKLSQTRLLCGCAFSCSRQVPPGTNTDRAQAGSACVVLSLLGTRSIWHLARCCSSIMS
jgi:hypothetical protein